MGADGTANKKSRRIGIDFLGAHEAGRVVLGLGIAALNGEMDLVLTEPLVDGIDGFHESFLTGAVLDLVGCKKVQLHTAVGLQLSQENTGLFILIMRQIESLEQNADRMNDSAGVIGRRSEFERIIGVVLREVSTMAVGSQKDRDGAA